MYWYLHVADMLVRICDLANDATTQHRAGDRSGSKILLSHFTLDGPLASLMFIWAGLHGSVHNMASR